MTHWVPVQPWNGGKSGIRSECKGQLLVTQRNITGNMKTKSKMRKKLQTSRYTDRDTDRQRGTDRQAEKQASRKTDIYLKLYSLGHRLAGFNQTVDFFSVSKAPSAPNKKTGTDLNFINQDFFSQVTRQYQDCVYKALFLLMTPTLQRLSHVFWWDLTSVYLLPSKRRNVSIFNTQVEIWTNVNLGAFKSAAYARRLK